MRNVGCMPLAQGLRLLLLLLLLPLLHLLKRLSELADVAFVLPILGPLAHLEHGALGTSHHDVFWHACPARLTAGTAQHTTMGNRGASSRVRRQNCQNAKVLFI